MLKSVKVDFVLEKKMQILTVEMLETTNVELYLIV